jgi:DNA-binding response OmpR family regulator
MKIAVNTDDNEFINEFIKVAKEKNAEIIVTKVESVLFDHIEKEDIDAYVLSNSNPYFKRAVDFIKKSNPYIPVIGVIVTERTFNIAADIYVDKPLRFEGASAYYTFSEMILYNIDTYIKTFTILKKLTTKLLEKIEFADCIYDPSRRLLSHRIKLPQTEEEIAQKKKPEYVIKDVKRLSQKEGGILEILANNYKEVVKKEIILEKVWRKTDYFAGRSMDVYISYLRNTFKNNKIKLTVKNISGIGLILDYDPYLYKKNE